MATPDKGVLLDTSIVVRHFRALPDLPLPLVALILAEFFDAIRGIHPGKSGYFGFRLYHGLFS